MRRLPERVASAALATLLVGCADDVLTMHAVSTDVNNVRNNRAELIVPVE